MRSAFEKLVAEAMDAIPEEFAKKLRNVAIVVEDEPTATQKRKLRLHRGHTLFGLYEGIPQAARGAGYTMVLPDKITIFQRPIEEAVRHESEIRAIVRDTVWHEIAHHFGMDEQRVRLAEKRRVHKKRGTQEN